MKRQRAEISSNVISHIKSAHPIEMWRSNKLGIKEKISRGKFPRLIFSCPVPPGLPHRSHCVPINMNPSDFRCFSLFGSRQRGGKPERAAGIMYNKGPVDKSKKTAETHSGSSRIINWEIAKDGILPSA